MFDYSQKLFNNDGPTIVPFACSTCVGSCKTTCRGDCSGTCKGDCAGTCNVAVNKKTK